MTESLSKQSTEGSFNLIQHFPQANLDSLLGTA